MLAILLAVCTASATPADSIPRSTEAINDSILTAHKKIYKTRFDRKISSLNPRKVDAQGTLYGTVLEGVKFYTSGDGFKEYGIPYFLKFNKATCNRMSYEVRGSKIVFPNWPELTLPYPLPDRIFKPINNGSKDSKQYEFIVARYNDTNSSTITTEGFLRNINGRTFHGFTDSKNISFTNRRDQKEYPYFYTVMTFKDGKMTISRPTENNVILTEHKVSINNGMVYIDFENGQSRHIGYLFNNGGIFKIVIPEIAGYLFMTEEPTKATTTPARKTTTKTQSAKRR